ncbi:MAG: patatin-like phospholipase family protein [Elusimicrobia bacterium]|nr:patatin-like phospholipase family protein [Elusimicrobiota bacterium]
MISNPVFSTASTIPSRTDEITRSFLSESDSIYYVSSGEPTNLKFLYTLPEEKQTVLKKIVLGEKFSSLFFPVSFVVPWSASTILPYKRGERPYLIQQENEPTQRVLNRIARSIGKLQVGLAMGSGAAYGYSLIGMLKVFQREKIPIDFVSGTSMGALIASFYAAGKSAEEIEEIAHSITKVWLRRNFLSDLNLPWPHGGLLLGQTVSSFLRSVLGRKEFKDMKIPFACVATDVMTGEGVVLREGQVWEAVRASLSLPLIFCPYRYKDHFFVDGGLVNPVPTSVIASMGADILISVNLTSNAAEKRVSLRRLGMFPAKSPGIFNIFFKMLYTMEYQVALSKVDLSHIAIRPQMKNFSWVDFHKAKQIIPLGEEAAEESLSKIKSKLPFFSDYCKVSLRLPH